ncbi:dipeptidase [Erwinia pyrifoliae]|uniref:dipeptidase n=1 Tax=Erwinia pyrifoliae TaxID=79967 RepID=UPI0001C132AE|nr:dipeptidase [Erwinia pyrifoliae]AUX73838.1 membrane dipeptidase [Erwinia pyrifoliae]MCA8875833.1 membrane dipeptidase [Erwinia pyrifoliae]UXK11806.1 dipeptidase [Erwinia pyrifoliae]CAY72949.1 renal dipeptidase family protein [Erwinia pyrifoliae DSM 12163]
MTDSSPLDSFFDGHNDLLLHLWLNHPENPADAFFNRRLSGHLDFTRMCQGGFAGGLFAVFVPPAEYVAKFYRRDAQQEAQRHDALAIAESQIAILQQLASQSGGRARICRSTSDIEHCLASGILAMVMHIEGAAALDGDLSQLDRWVDAGLRSIGPFWNLPNRFGFGVSGSFPGSPDTGKGLTTAGKQLIHLCNQRRLMIDVSHMNEKAFWDTARLSNSPLVASHSNVHALCPQPRNLTDSQLAAIADSDGLVGLNFGTAFLRRDGQRGGDMPLSVMVQHLDYLLEKLGEDRVAFGSDFDGVSLADDIGDVSGLPRLLAVLRKAGYSEPLLEKLCRANWLGVLRKTWGK